MLSAFMKNLRIIFLLLISSVFVNASPISITYSLKQSLAKAKPAARTGILISLAKAYETEGNTASAIEYYTQALDIFTRLKNEKGIADCQADRGILLLKQKQYSPAKAAYNNAIKSYRSVGDKKSIIGVMKNIGILEEAIGQNDSATLYYLRGISLAAELGDSTAALSLFINQGNHLLQLEKFAEAKKMLNTGIALARKSGSQDEQIRGMHAMAELHFKQGNVKDAFNYLKLTSHFSDSISTVRHKQSIAAIEVKYGMELKETQNQSTQPQNLTKSNAFANSPWIIGFLIILSMIIGIISTLFYMRYKGKAQNAGLLNEKNAEIEKLENELKILNTAREKIFSIISQDLRKPFTTVLGFADVLKEDYANIDEKDRILYVRAIHSASFNIYELLKNLLDWSRSQTNAQECRPALIDLNQLMDQNVQLFASYAHNKNIQLGLDISGEAVVYADRNMVSSVIRNLLNNAIKFTNKGGEVHVTVKDVDHRSELSVTDTGMGIAEDDLRKIFQPGQINRTKGTADELGTGLGLILCKEFVTMNKGTIRAESSPGKGSRFTVSLPVRSPESVQ